MTIQDIKVLETIKEGNSVYKAKQNAIAARKDSVD